VAGSVGDVCPLGASALVYDPGRSWTAHTATLLLNGEVLAASGSGCGDNGMVASAELFDPGSGAWTATGRLIQPRYLHAASSLLDGRVPLTGGQVRGGEALASAELYDPGAGSWTATVSMIEARAAPTATLLRDGKVLVVGGYNTNLTALASAELYDPGSGS